MGVRLYKQWVVKLICMRFRVKCSFTTCYSFHYKEKESPRNDELLLNLSLTKKCYSWLIVFLILFVRCLQINMINIITCLQDSLLEFCAQMQEKYQSSHIDTSVHYYVSHFFLSLFLTLLLNNPKLAFLRYAYICIYWLYIIKCSLIHVSIL